MTYFDVNTKIGADEKAIKETAHQFAGDVLRPAAIAIDRMPASEAYAEGSPFWPALRQGYELGFHKAAFPEEIGGGGLTPLQTHILLEELLWGSIGITGTMFLGAWSFGTLLATGNQKLIDEFTIPFINCTDASLRGCWGVIEPDRGSDHFGHGEKFYTDPNVRGQVRATRDGDGWVLNGQKAAWVSAAPVATHAMLNLQIDSSRGLAGGGVCFLPLNLPGVSKGKPLEKIGQRDLPQGELFFDNVRIPGYYMFAEPDNFPPMVMAQLGHGNSFMSILATSIGRACLEECLDYTKNRIQGGKRLCDQYAMKIRLHRMFGKVEACRAMSRAVWELNNTVHPPLAEYAFAAKVFCTEMAMEVAQEAIRIHGGNGMTKEYLVEKLYRDAAPLSTEDGDNNALSRAGGEIIKDTYPRLDGFYQME